MSPRSICTNIIAHTKLPCTGEIISKQERLLYALLVHIYLPSSHGLLFGFLNRYEEVVKVCEKEMAVSK